MLRAVGAQRISLLKITISREGKSRFQHFFFLFNQLKSFISVISSLEKIVPNSIAKGLNKLVEGIEKRKQAGVLFNFLIIVWRLFISLIRVNLKILNRIFKFTLIKCAIIFYLGIKNAF